MRYYIEVKTHLIIISMILLVSIVLTIKPMLFQSVHFTCILKSIFGLNCPFCGMTRDFILMSTGAKPIHNPFSLVCALMAFFIYPVLFVFFVLQRKRISIHYSAARTIFILAMLGMFIFNNMK